MPDLNIRNVALELIVELKKSALDHGITLREFCIGVLSGPRLGFVAKKAGVAHQVEHRFSSPEAAGSSPAPRSKKVKVPEVDLTLNDGIPADADVPPHVWPTYGGITRSGDPTTPTIGGYYPPSDAGNLTVEMLASVANVRGPRTPAKLETDSFKIASNRVKIKKANDQALAPKTTVARKQASVKKSTAWFMNEKCPHGWMNSAVCEKNDGGCVR